VSPKDVAGSGLLGWAAARGDGVPVEQGAEMVPRKLVGAVGLCGTSVREVCLVHGESGASATEAPLFWGYVC
jgi:hypothetical protein